MSITHTGCRAGTPLVRRLFYVATCREDMRRLIELRRQGGRIPKAATSRRTPNEGPALRNQKLAVADVPEPRVDREAVVGVTAVLESQHIWKLARGYAGLKERWT